MTTRPHENCYWVVPDRLMAGEYPAAARVEDTYRKLAAIAAAGVRHFIDLSEKHALVAPYDVVLPRIAQAQHTEIGYDRFAIQDMGIPETPELTNAILDRIDAVMAEGKIPYVHCWGGVGRTGTIVGCWLVRHGLGGEAALKLIANRWTLMDKRNRYPRSPETPAQESYIRNWVDHDMATKSPPIGANGGGRNGVSPD